MTRYGLHSDSSIPTSSTYMTVTVSVIRDVREDGLKHSLIRHRMMEIKDAMLSIGMEIVGIDEKSVVFEGDVKGGYFTIFSLLKTDKLLCHGDEDLMSVYIQSHNLISRGKDGTYEGKF